MANSEIPTTESGKNETGGNIDPLYVANSDNPTASLVTAIFSGTNFMRWSRNVRRALIAKNKEGFINGVLKIPDENDKEFQKWKRADYMVMSWILSSMSPDIADEFGFLATSAELWLELQERFGQSNGPLIYQLKKEIDSLKQENMSIVAYYGKIKKLWDEMQSLRLLPICSCGALSSCTCNFLKKLQDLENDDKLMQFLLGLNSGFQSTISNVLSTDPLPSINRAFSMLQQIEKQQEITGGCVEIGAESSAMAAQRMYKTSNTQRMFPNVVKKDWKKDKLDKTCNHCKNRGHTVDQCFQLIGYPDWYNTIKSGKKNGGAHKLAANVHTDYNDTPLDNNNSSQHGIDSDMLAVICQQVMQTMKGKQSTETGGVTSSFASFAGIDSFACSINNSCDSVNWIIDSGACDHMVFDESLLFNTINLHTPIKVGLPDGSYRLVKKVGKVVLTDNLILHNVMLVEGFRHNLLSIGKLVDNSEITVRFTKYGCCFQDHISKKVIAEGHKYNGLYYFSARSLKNSSTAEVLTTNNVCNVAVTDLVVQNEVLLPKTSTSIKNKGNYDLSLDLIHARLGHVSLSKMQHIDVCNCKNLKEYNCNVCFHSKQQKLPFSPSSSRANDSFDLIHLDLWGPYKVKALNGASYFLTILDDYSRVVWTFLLHNKLQVVKTITDFLVLIETQFGKKVKSIRSDNGTEIIKDQCMNLFAEKGIFHQKSVPYVPQQNGRVERKHKHLLEMSRAFRFHAKLPKKFWGDCLLAATHVINKLPTKVLQWKSPYEVMFHKIPSYDNLRVFGCLCYAYNMKVNRDKFDNRSRKCIFLGYPYGQKAYKVYDLQTHTCFVSRDIIFFETIFPYPVLNTSNSTLQIPLVNFGLDTESDSGISSNPISDKFSSPNIGCNDASSPIPILSSNMTHDSDSSAQFIASDNSLPHTTSSSTTTSPIHDLSAPHIPRYPARSIKPPSKLTDFVQTYIPHKNTLPSSSPISSESASFAVNSHQIVEPKHYNQAKHNPHWIQAMHKEIEALEANETWVLTPLPEGKRAIGSKWVYKTKLNPDGSIERYKARLVAIGYQQIEGQDFTQTFAPVAKLATVRVLVAVAVARNWPLCQLDVNNAFLHGFLDEEVYMVPPAGYNKAGHNEVCKLKKSIYGLKQASRQWNKELSKFLRSLGFIQSKQDYSLFTRSLSGEFVAVLVYVDDMLVTGTNMQQINDVKHSLDKAFTIKDLGALNYFLGIQISRNSDGIFLSQKKYIRDIIADCGMEEADSSPAPLPTGLKLSTEIGDILDEPEVYRRLIGRLLYLGLTRPDLSYPVQHLSQFLHQPRVPHLRAALHVVKYLQGTVDYGLFYPSMNNLQVKAYSDADWSACQFTSRSLNAYAVFIGDSLVSWKTKKQQTVSKSSAEAEYRSMSATASELVWLNGLLEDLQVNVQLPIVMYCDNTSAEHLAQNPKFHEKTKHLKRDMHYVREQVEEGFISTAHVKSVDQLADLLTKSLASTHHHVLCSKLGLVSQVKLEGGI